jgi:hypothetical protein
MELESMSLDLRLARLLGNLLVGVFLLTGCVGPSGGTPEEKRQSALEMRDRALSALYADKPELKEKVEESAGYAVFSNFSVHPGLISFASGYGVLTDNATKAVTHHRWKRLTLGPGLAVKGLYALAILEDAEDVERLATGPWMLGGQAELGFVFGDFGGSLEAGWSFNRDVDVYYTTHTGVALEVELIGLGKVSNDRALNETSAP